MLILTACAADAGELEPPPVAEEDVDRTPPAVSVAFPGAIGLTDATSVTVRGSASDASGVASVRVDGALAKTSDGFASWSLQVALTPDENVLTVSAEDVHGNVSGATQLLVTSEPLLLADPSAVAVDHDTSRVLLADHRYDRVISVDTSGDRTLVSGQGRGDGPALVDLTDIALDGDRALVLTDGELIAVDLTTGDRTILSGALVGSGPRIRQPRGLAIGSGRAYTCDQAGSAVFAIDLATGDRTIISDDDPAGGRPLYSCAGLALDGDRALVVLRSQGTGLVAVDLETGERTSITEIGDEFGARGPSGVVLDDAHRRALVAIEDGLIAIDLATGERTVLSDVDHGGGPALGQALDLDFDPSSGRVHFISWVERGPQLWRGRHMIVETDSGDRRPAFDRAVGVGPSLSRPFGVALDGPRRRALVTDTDNKLVSVDLSTGDRTVVSSLEVEGHVVTHPSEVILDGRDQVIVAGWGEDRLVSVDLRNGDATVLEADDAAVVHVMGLALDPIAHRALLVGYWAGEWPTMVSQDLDSGERTVLIDEAIGRAEDLLLLSDVAVEGRTALVTSEYDENLVAVDLDTGARTVVADAETGGGPPLARPEAVVFDGRSRAVVLGGGARISTVDLSTRVRRIQSDTEAGAGPELARANDLAPGPAAGTVLVTDESLDGLLLVDVDSGERMLISGAADGS